jgi:hypothetical protein
MNKRKTETDGKKNFKIETLKNIIKNFGTFNKRPSYKDYKILVTVDHKEYEIDMLVFWDENEGEQVTLKDVKSGDIVAMGFFDNRWISRKGYGYTSARMNEYYLSKILKCGKFRKIRYSGIKEDRSLEACFCHP